MKNVFKTILVVTLTLLFMPNVVKAIDVLNPSDFKTALQDKATISENTITLTDNVVLDNSINILDGTYVLDLAEHTISGNASIFFEITNASLTVKNGTINGEQGNGETLFELYEKSNLIIEGGTYSSKVPLLIAGATSTTDDYTIGEEPNITIKNGTFTQKDDNLLAYMYAGNLTIENGDFSNTNLSDSSLFYFDAELGFLNVTIENGIFTNESSNYLIDIEGGNLTIKDGDYTSRHGFIFIDNDFNLHGEGNAINIKDGTFTGYYGIEFDGDYIPLNDSIKLVIDGGSITSTGDRALYLRSGEVVVNGGSITGFYTGLYVDNPDGVEAKLYGGVYTATTQNATQNYGGVNIKSDTDTDELILSLLGDSCVYSPNTITNQFIISSQVFTKTATPVRVLCPKNITIKSGITKGTVAPSKSLAFPGEEVTLTVTPSAGYKLKSLSILDKFDEEPVTITDNKFTMPDYNVFIAAEFELINPETGDRIGTSILFSSIALIGILFLEVLNKKKRHN